MTPLDDLVIGIDAGTSSVKTGILTLRGQLLALESEAYGLSSPEDGAMEQDGEAWWSALVTTLRRALARVEIRERPIAVAIGGQGPGLSVRGAPGAAGSPATTR